MSLCSIAFLFGTVCCECGRLCGLMTTAAWSPAECGGQTRPFAESSSVRRPLVQVRSGSFFTFALMNWLTLSRLTGSLSGGLCGRKLTKARDDFLVLPSCDFTSWVKAEARYADSVACGRALFQRLTDTAGRPLLHTPLAARFWSEQSDRCTLVSLAACLDQLNAEWFEELGRWSSRMSSRYVRTHIYKVRVIQRAVALEIRSNQYVPHRFGEEELFTRWASFLCIADN